MHRNAQGQIVLVNIASNTVNRNAMMSSQCALQLLGVAKFLAGNSKEKGAGVHG
jgi:hypothetical protein